jgi:hypothetical protein
LVDGGPEFVWCLSTSSEVIEDGDELAKDEVHQREEDSSSDHAKDGYCCCDPSYRVIVHENTLATVSDAELGGNDPSTRRLTT